MPKTIDDQTFAALKQVVSQIDFRAKRLTDWRRLSLVNQNAESRFEVFKTTLLNAADPPTGPELNALDAAWDECNRQLIEMTYLPDEYQFITLVLGDAVTPDNTVKTWLDELVAAGKAVGTALKNRSMKELQEKTGLYKGEFTKFSIRREAKVSVEVSTLATATNDLAQKFSL